MIEQVPKFNYLGIELIAKRGLKQKVRIQATKAAHISSYLYNLVWLNIYIYININSACSITLG